MNMCVIWNERFLGESMTDEKAEILGNICRCFPGYLDLENATLPLPSFFSHKLSKDDNTH